MKEVRMFYNPNKVRRNKKKEERFGLNAIKYEISKNAQSRIIRKYNGYKTILLNLFFPSLVFRVTSELNLL